MEKSRKLRIDGVDKIIGVVDLVRDWKVNSVGNSLDSYIFELMEDVDGFTNRNVVKLWKDGVFKLQMGEWCFKIDALNSKEAHWVTSSQIRDMKELSVNLVYVVQRSRV